MFVWPAFGRLARRRRRFALVFACVAAPACTCGDDVDDPLLDSGIHDTHVLTSGDAATGDGEDTSGESTSGDVDPIDPGRMTLHRLNRTEYDNTIRDLLGVDSRPAKDFPSEDPSFGFDNIADVLTISPLQLELYERTAESLAAQVLELPIVDPQRQHFEAEDIFQSVGAECCGGFWNIYSNGQVYTTVDIPADGEYEIIARAAGHLAGDELPHMVFEVQGRVVAETDVGTTQNAPMNYSTRIELSAGSQQIGVAFTNDFYDPDNNLDRNLLVDWIEVYGPFDVDDDGENPLRERIVICDPRTDGERPCLERIIRAFTRRAWRRPSTDAEVLELVEYLDVAREHGGDFEDALHLVVQASLLSPHFLFRVELDPDPNQTGSHELSAWELASRLSYFLWSSMPDESLFAAAADGSLLSDTTLHAQVDRMLADRKSRALIDNFAGQWLAIRAMDDLFKDTATFPEFDDQLAAAMRRERELFFEHLLTESRSVDELVTADYGFLNARLAEFYGLVGPADGFARVDLGVTNRRGVLGQAGLMSVLAHPQTTSPVRRGKWVMDKLLCQPPPPPPSDIDIPELDPQEGETMRERLAQHREDPACAGCHALMDPIGLGLERFDAIGGFRELEGGRPIDATGNLPGGANFDGAAQLGPAIAADGRFEACLAEQMLIYALGRGPRPEDEVHLDAIVAEFSARGRHFPGLIHAIVQSPTFRMRNGERR